MTSEPPPPPATRSYDGEGITVSYDAHRCLHAAECVRGLPSVFEVGRKPWIVPGDASADEIAEVIHRCPSGALQYRRSDGLPDEVPDVPTQVSLHSDGVLHLRGDLEVATPEGPRRETRVMLCGCGRTGNTPYCDHSGDCARHI
ncbi:(4Fe-4S)-binding protein [Streptomyces sp. NBC_00234]|uniref:(4Fe-4S)-binding protein n=1 Tax=Streptomyces sp. NBC_00234 TaxID=2903638 RepID=UPI002E2D92D3|nr:(4Fe-4S)-binding protein [Streptomyces sp. NBC_00234]